MGDPSSQHRAPKVQLPASSASLPDPLSPAQSLQNSSYNHFAAIYYLLLERLKEYRSTQPVARPGPARQPRPRSSDLSSCEVRVGLLPKPCSWSLPWVESSPVNPCLDVGRDSSPCPRLSCVRPRAVGCSAAAAWQPLVPCLSLVPASWHLLLVTCTCP